MYVELRKCIDFKIAKYGGIIKMVKKKVRTTKCCPSPISAINYFLKANLPNSVRILFKNFAILQTYYSFLACLAKYVAPARLIKPVKA